MNRNQGEKITYYYYSSEPLHQIIDLPLTKPSNSVIYSKNTSHGNKLTILNEKLDISFIPISQIKKDINQEYFPIAAYSRDYASLKEFELKFYEAYSSVIDSIDEMSSDQFDYDRNFRMQITKFFILGIALFMILSIFQISDNLNNISIMKMHGYSFVSIGINLLRPIIVEILLFEFLASIFTIVLSKIPLNNVSLAFLKDYIYAISLVNLALASILFGVFIIVKFITLPKLLKGLNYNKSLLNLAFTAKIIMLFFIVPMLVPLLNSLYININFIKEINSSISNFDNTYYVENLSIQDRFSGYNPIKYLSGKTDEVFEEHKRIYDYFNHRGSLIYFTPRSIGVEDAYIKNQVNFYEGYQINAKYMEINNLKDANGKNLKLDLWGSTVYVLIPESMYNDIKVTRDLFSIEDDNEVKLILIADQKYLDYGLSINSPTVLPDFQKTPFFILYSDNSYRYDKSILFGTYLINFDSLQEVQTELNAISPNIEYEILESKPLIEQFKNNLMRNIENLLIAIFPGIGVYTIMSLSVIFLYYRASIKKVLLHKIMGYSIVASNFDLFIELILTILVPSMVLYKDWGTNIFPVISILLLLDIVCWFYVRIHSKYRINNFYYQKPLKSL